MLTLAVKDTALTGTLVRNGQSAPLSDRKVSEGFSGELAGNEIRIWLDRQGESRAIVLRRAKAQAGTDAREGTMGKGFLSLATATILNAVSNGYSFGFDIIDITGMPGGTVYPALRRLEEAGYLRSQWEKERVARAELRPRRRYYEITPAGRQALADAVKRYRLLDQARLSSMREPKSSRA